jgi:diadenosine tetraphosphatase ApaH/serine/threonine PP2A family protein phosphatase
VHGNLPALDAVLADALGSGVERFWLGGDYALFGGWPAETVERLRGVEPEVMIRGNVERWAADPGQAPGEAFFQEAIADCRQALGAAEADALGALPVDGARDGWHIVHASPAGDMDGLLPRARDDEERLLADAREPRVLCGHTHMAFRRESFGVEIVNPGSVGIPLDGDHRASYVLLGDDGEVVNRRVEYDWQAAIDQLDEAFPGAAWTTEIAGRIERARMV